MMPVTGSWLRASLRAGNDAGGILAGAAGHGGDEDLVHAHRADAAAVGVELTGFGIGTHVLAHLAADAHFWVTCNIFVFGCGLTAILLSPRP